MWHLFSSPSRYSTEYKADLELSLLGGFLSHGCAVFKGSEKMKRSLGSRKRKVRGVEERQERDSGEMSGLVEGRLGEEYGLTFWFLSPNSCFLLPTGSIKKKLVKAAITFTQSSVDPGVFGS